MGVQETLATRGSHLVRFQSKFKISKGESETYESACSPMFSPVLRLPDVKPPCSTRPLGQRFSGRFFCPHQYVGAI